MSGFRWAVLMGTAGCALLAAPVGLQARDLPPSSARPGQCYGKVTAPAAYTTSTRQVLVKKGWTETRRTAAVTEKVARKVEVSREVVERHRIAPTYRTVVEWVEHPGAVRHVVEPARYDVVREKVEIEPGHAEWRRQTASLAYGEVNSGQTLVQPTGEIVCRVWVPGRYKTVERRVQVSAERSYDVTGPSRREKLVRRELVSPGGWRETRKPAVYKTVYETHVVTPASERVIEHPAVYRTVTSRTLVHPASQSWRRLPNCKEHVVARPAPRPRRAVVHHEGTVICHVCTFEAGHAYSDAAAPAVSGLDPAWVARIQRALIAKGYDPGVPDGQANPRTYSAVRAFQNQRGLPQTGLSRETAQALGVD